MKRTLIFFLLAAFLLTGCSGGEPASAQGSSDISDSEAGASASTSAQTEEMTREAEETVEADSAGAESELTAETESGITEDAESSEPTEGNASEQARLAELIWNIIPAEDRGGEFNIRPIFFGDYDGDGTEELLAAHGIHSETGDSGTWYVSGLYFASGDTALMLRGGVERLMSEPRVIRAGGDTLFTMEFMYPTGSRTEAWVLENGGLFPVTIDSAVQMELTQTDGCEFTALHSTYDWYTFGAGHTWKPYFLYYSPERNRFEQHKLREIASEEFAQAYDGTEEILKRVSDEGGEVCNILRGDNGVIYVNYLAEKKFAFFTFSVNGRQLADITHEDNRGYYIADVTLRQRELEQLILDSIPDEDKREGYELINPIADDFDGDGHGELLAIYGDPSQEDKTLGWGDVWFAGIHGAQRLYSTWYYESPALATPDGVFLCCVCPGPQGEELRPWYIEDSTPYPAAPEGSSALASLNYDEETGEYICRVTTANMLEAAELFGDILETETLRCTFDKEQRRLVDLS